MKKNRFLLLFTFALFVFLPFSVNASGKDGDFVANGSKYVIEKNDMICKIDGKEIDLVNDENIVYSLVDDNGNLVYLDIENMYVYLLGKDGCNKYRLEEKEGIEYIIHLSYLPEYYYDIDGQDIKLFKEYVQAVPAKHKETNESLNFIAIPSLDIDENIQYYMLEPAITEDYKIAVPVDFEYVSQELEENISKASKFFVAIDNTEVREKIMTITNDDVLKLLNDENGSLSVYDYNEKTKVAYFIYYDDNGYKVIDSNGKVYNDNKVFNHSNLIWSLKYVDDVLGEFQILDNNQNLLYTFSDVYNDDSFEDNNLYSTPMKELYYKDYVYGLIVNGNNNLYNIYEYKLLSENNRKTDGKTDFVTKFSGLYDRVKSVKVDTNELDKKYVTSGSTIVTLDTEYLNTLTDGKHTITVEYIDGVELTSDFTLETDSSGVTYNLTFDANGGKFEDKDTYVVEDITNFDYTKFNKPTRNGYKFIGFFTEKTNGISFEEVMNSEAGIEEDMTFYARWEKIETEENPKTFDGIGTSIFMGTISLIGLAGATIYLKKRNKVRA